MIYVRKFNIIYIKLKHFIQISINASIFQRKFTSKNYAYSYEKITRKSHKKTITNTKIYQVCYTTYTRLSHLFSRRK